jgi:hypothetical protein
MWPRMMGGFWRGTQIPATLRTCRSRKSRIPSAVWGDRSTRTHIAFSHRDWSITVWEPETGKQTRLPRARMGTPDALAFSSDNRLLAAAGIAGSVTIWDIATKEALLSFQASASGSPGWARDIAFVAGDSRIICRGKLFDAESGIELFDLGCESAVFSADGRAAVGTVDKNSIRLLETTLPKPTINRKRQTEPKVATKEAGIKPAVRTSQAPMPEATTPPTVKVAPKPDDCAGVGENVLLTYSTDLEAFHVDWYDPQRIDLSEHKPSNLTGVADVEEAVTYFGELRFGVEGQRGRFNLVFLDSGDATFDLLVDTNGNHDLSDDSRTGLAKTHVVELTQDNAGRKLPFAVEMYFWRERGRPVLGYYRHCLTHGFVALDGKVRPVALLNETADGDYGSEAYLMCVIDMNGDGIADGREEAITHDRAIYLESGNAYKIAEIGADGRTIRFEAAGTGMLEGRVLSSDGSPIGQATVMVRLGDLSTVTNQDGAYDIEVAESRWTGITVCADDFVPHLGGIEVSAGQSTTYNVDLQPVEALSGQITLEVGDSYHSLGNRQTFGSANLHRMAPRRYDAVLLSRGGDLHFKSGNGICSLGELGASDLTYVTPETYSTVDRWLRTVRVQDGYTYVCRASRGEEGNIILLRVVMTTANSATMEWRYVYVRPSDGSLTRQ